MEIVSAHVETRGVFKEAAASDAPKPVKDSPPADQQDQDLVRQTVGPPPRVQEDRSPPTGGVDAGQTMTPSRSTRSATGPPESSVRPSGDAVKPLKLRKDQDATPPLENKSPEQLLAIRKVTAETLAQRSRENGHWATLTIPGIRALKSSLGPTTSALTPGRMDMSRTIEAAGRPPSAGKIDPPVQSG